ncbi:Olfactory receptor 5A1 [Sciurus carolinensis]|uniref:Olfactory receptor 5A1 n=1 Tax=Sciurus carolinensis TaxID=30640 RepID=A0AA41T3T1_SCICA|nr:Olfactory receptor 5A1 [Sciurus carolinensis]
MGSARSPRVRATTPFVIQMGNLGHEKEVVNDCVKTTSIKKSKAGLSETTQPLQYSAVMAPGLCQRMVAGVCGSGFLSSLVQTSLCFHLYYCGPNIIRHFFCDIPQIMTLSCSDSFISQLILFLAAVFVGFGSFLLILLSYGFIAASILKISSLQGCAKALNTCTSHLATVTLFYGTALSVYTHHSSSHTTEQDKVLSVFYVILIPMLNPLIYSLRNKEIKEALRRVIKKVAS